MDGRLSGAVSLASLGCGDDVRDPLFDGCLVESRDVVSAAVRSELAERFEVADGPEGPFLGSK